MKKLKLKAEQHVHVKFVDWIPGICSALGMLVIKSCLDS